MSGPSVDAPPVGRGRRRRSVWSRAGRAHIEVRGVHRRGTEPLAHHLEAELVRLEGVDWAEVDQAAGELLVSFDEGQLDLADVLDLVAAVEDAHDVGDERFPSTRAEHPGDPAPIQRQALALAADVAGLGLSLFTRVLRNNPLSAEVASLVGLVDSTPQLRTPLEDRFGPAADLGLAAGNALAQSLAGGPLGLAVDAAHRVLQLQELTARRALWEEREAALTTGSGRRGRRARDTEPPGPSELPHRPGPLPPGPVGTYATRAVAAGLAAAVGAVAVTKDPRMAVAATVAATPKAARLGREAFAARLGARLAERGVLTMDPGALRRLDLVDTVVLDADVLRTGRSALGELWAPAGRRGQEEALWLAAHGLLDPEHGQGDHRGDGFRLRPVRVPDLPAHGPVRAAGRALARAAAQLAALEQADDLAALVQVRSALDPLAGPLAEAGRQVGDLYVAGRREALPFRLGAVALPGGTAILREVRRLQGEGRVVALVSAHQHTALAAADVGIAVARPGARPPLAADLVTEEGLADAWLVIQTIALARRTSRRNVEIARYGAGVAGLLALAGPRRGATARATLGVNGAAAVALGASTLAASQAAGQHVPALPEPVPWHALPLDRVLGQVQSSREGLRAGDASARAHARPEPVEHEQVSLLAATAQELANPLTPALGSGAALSAAAGSFTDAALISAVMGLNALLGGLQRVGADRALQRLLDASAVRVHVRRDGSEVLVDADEVVVGDVVVLHAGDAVPADCRVLEAHGVQVDEASLTGESALVRKDPAPTSARAVAERSSMLYAGTSVAAGEAVAVVVATDDQTELGRTTAAAGGVRHRPAGVEQRLRRLTAQTVPAVLGAGAAVVAGGLLHGRPLPSTLSTGVGLAVAAVPEGLPTVATVAQLAAARRLAGRGALVRHASTVEALGRVDVLCADKTGTLTTGKISLRLVSDGASEQEVGELDALGRAVLATALRACPVQREGVRTAHPTDRAVTRGAREAGVGLSSRSGTWQPLHALPFEPSRGYHAVLGRAGRVQTLVVKGAPEVLLPRCTRWRRRDGLLDLDARSRRQVEDEVHRLARHGFRVLAVAERNVPGGGGLDDGRVRRLELCGLLALGDPVRETAAAAVHGLRAAGVDVLMVTGDHPSTAAAVAAELGLLDAGEVLTGPDLERLDDDALSTTVKDARVFARVTPEQKVRIVAALQRAGHVVAMTGDGANDAAAISLADVGFALGERATNAAKEAADVVVTDERIETTIDAILEGRAMWASVRDAVAVLLGGNLGEVAFTVGTGLLLPGGSPLNARQLLLVNLFTDLVPALALAVRPPTSTDPERLAAEGPEASLGSVLTRDVGVRGAVTAAAGAAGYSAARLTGLTPGRASTTALASVVGSQLAQTLVAGWRSPLVVGSSLASAAALAGVIQTPGVSQFFGCRPLGPVAWSIAAASAAGSAVAAPLLDAAVGAVLDGSVRRGRPAEGRGGGAGDTHGVDAVS